MLTLRSAKVEDVKYLTKMGWDWAEEVFPAIGAEWELVTTAKTVVKCITHDDCVLIVAVDEDDIPKAAIGGELFTSLYCEDDYFILMQFFVVDKSLRRTKEAMICGDLINAFCLWGDSVGARHVVGGIFNHIPEKNVTERLFKKFGFEPVETLYRREL